MRKTVLILAIILWGFLSARAQQDTTVSLIELYSLDDLINLKITTAGKKEQKIEQVAANVEILTRKEIELMGFQNLSDLLDNIGGFYPVEDFYWLGSRNYGVGGFFKTGPFANVSILVNGISQISDKYSDYPDVKISIPLEAVERIEIVKGPMVLMYGSNAFFGAINIITKQNSGEKELEGQWLGGASSAPGGRSVLNLQLGSGEIKSNFIMQYDYDQGRNMPYTHLTSDTAYLRYVGLETESTTNKHLKQKRFYSGVNMSYKGFSADFSYNENIKGVFDGSPSLGGNLLNTYSANFVLAYNKKWGEKIWLSSSLGYFTHSHLLNYELFHDYYYELDYQKTKAIEGNLDFNYQWNAKGGIQFGYNNRTVIDILQLSDFAYYGLNYGDGEIGLPKNENFATQGFYARLMLNPLKRLSLSAGLRLEHLDEYNMYYARGVVSEAPADNRDPLDPANRLVETQTYHPAANGFSLVPNLAVIYNLYKNHYFKVLYGEAAKQPSFTENYRQILQNRPELQVSKIQTLELVYYSFSGNKMMLNAAGFYSRLSNLVNSTNVYDAQTGEWEIYSTNSGQMNTSGIELSVKYYPLPQVTFYASGTFQQSRSLKEGYENIAVPYSPHWLSNGHIVWQALPNLLINASYRYVGKMLTEWVSDAAPADGQRLGKESNAYFISDLNIRQEKLFGTNIFISLKINNLLNTKYSYPATTSNRWMDLGVPGELIKFYLQAGIKL